MLKVLSLFDGLGGAKVALNNLGIENRYYSSEIDKYASEIANKNHKIFPLGDVKNIPLWGDYPRTGDIDLLIGGSPCQGLSNAGNREGLTDNRSILFWEYLRLLWYYKPKYFILENVFSMKKADRAIITELMGVEPIMINSALVTAQHRKRLYWTNIEGIEQPEDREIYLKDIIEDDAVDRDKSYCIDACYYKGTDIKHRRQAVLVNKPDRLGLIGKSDTRGGRVYSIYGKSITLMANGGGWGAKTGLYYKQGDDIGEFIIRKLTPIECERLQGLKDNHTSGVSNTQRYKMIGNGFTIPVIEHILSYMK